MPSFPILDRASFAPIGRSLSIDDYFNPTKNGQFGSASAIASNNCTTIKDIVTIINNVITEENLPYLTLCVGDQTSGGIDKKYRQPLYKALYEALPDDKKYLTFFSYVKAVHHLENNRHEFTINIRYPNEIYYREVSKGNKSYTVAMPLNNPAVEDPTALKEAIAANLELISSKYETFWNTEIYYRDTFFPGIISTIYAYANDLQTFWPMNDSSEFYEWTRPSQIKECIDDGYKLKLTLMPKFDRVYFELKTKPGDRRAISRVLNYSTNVLDILPYTIKGPKEAAATLYGVELEACADYTPKQIIDAQKDLFFIMKSDGSIAGRGEHRYEMVTVPASMKAHKRLWGEFFNNVDYTKFDTSTATGNGMHIHVDRKAFKHDHLNRFTWFLINPANYDFLFTVSERPTKQNMQQWAPVPASVNNYTKPRASRAAISLNRGMRGMIHYKSDKTVEIRMFKGIVSYATIVKNIEFVDSVVEFSRVTNLSQLNLRNYLTWLQATPKNRYETFKTFLSESKMEDIIAAAEVTEYIWKMDEYDDVITDKLNKAPFTVTNKHVTVLNKKRRKRTFILKNGKVECLTKRGGLLSKLDLAIQKKQTRGSASFTLTNIN